MKFLKLSLRYIYRVINNRVVKWLIMPIFLLFIWFFLSLAYSSSKSFTVLQFTHNQDSKNVFINKQLLKNQSLIGQFVAKENNLGIIAVKFGKIPKINSNLEDTILFRVKEKGSGIWFYENYYKSGLGTSYRYLTFGFPIVELSKGKTYIFEMLSLNGNSVNAMQTTDSNPVYLSKYKFSKSEVFSSYKFLKSFMINKINTFYTDYDTVVSSSLFLLPLIFYILWITVAFDFAVSLPYEKLAIVTDSFLKWRKQIYALIVIFLYFGYIMIYEGTVTGFTLGLLGGWIIAVYANKIKSTLTFLFAFILIIFSVIIVYLKLTISIDKISTVAYLLLIFAFVQSTYESTIKK